MPGLSAFDAPSAALEGAVCGAPDTEARANRQTEDTSASNRPDILLVGLNRVGGPAMRAGLVFEFTECGSVMRSPAFSNDCTNSRNAESIFFGMRASVPKATTDGPKDATDQEGDQR